MSENDTPTFVKFNPTSDPRVDVIKMRTDELIALVDEYANDTPDGKRRAALARTNYEQAAMWAVKACFS